MKLSILSDNLACGDFEAEWGLSIHIEYNGRNLLLDTGASPLFLRNARRLGIDMEKVEFAVLSHAHYDHADGMAAFFAANKTAPLYLRADAAEDCCAMKEGRMEYIGIRTGWLEEYRERLRPIAGAAILGDGVTLLPHKAGPDLREAGLRAGMYRRRGDLFEPDTFTHEQSVVLETEKGLVVLNSCSHAGADRILWEVSEAFPGQRLYAMIGGFHLFKSSEREVRALASRLRALGAAYILTGHCTGQEAYDILREELGDCVAQMHAGLEITL